MLYLSVSPMRLPTDDATNKLFKWELFNQGYYVRLDLLQFEISEYQIIFPPYILPKVTITRCTDKEVKSTKRKAEYLCTSYLFL